VQTTFPVSPAEVHDALRAVSSIDIGDQVDFYLALRSVLLWSPDAAALFDALYQRFWGGWSDDLIRESSIPNPDLADEGRIEAAAGKGEYSPMEVLLQKDFADFKPDELAAVARACVEIARRIATRRSRRYRATSRGTRIDARRSISGT
jgi:uncharacterized protein with von Willebrand factor type A (vWA) domain